MSLFARIRSYLTKKVLIISAVIVVGGGIVFAATRPEPAPIYDTSAVTRRDLVEEVDVTGQVKPTEEVSLAFEASGRVVAVKADVGDVVAQGQLIASLDASELYAQLASARASAASAQSVLNEYKSSLAAEQAKLDELNLGTRPEELFVSQTKVANAERSLDDAYAHQDAVIASGKQELSNLYLSVVDVLNDAYTKADEAVLKDTDEMFSKDIINKNELVFIVQSQTNKSNAENARGEAMAAVEDFADRLAVLPTDQNELDRELSRALDTLATVQAFLTSLNIALNDSVGLSASVLAGYKADVSSARNGLVSMSSAINKQIQSISAQRVNNQQELTNAQNQVNEAKSTLQLAQSELALKKSGSLPEQIRQQEARVQQAQLVLNTQAARVQQTFADVQRINAQLGNYAIYSPLNGVVTKQEAEVGEIMASNATVVTIISQNAFEIVTNVPEADIAKVQIGNVADLTLDAYSDSVHFNATVIKIDPAQTTIEGVSTYKVTLQFEKEDDRVRSGMTANIVMTTGKREQVLSIPQRAIISRNSHKVVQLQGVGGQVTEVPVTTGLQSSDGFVEVIDGLKEGDLVVVASRTAK